MQTSVTVVSLFHIMSHIMLHFMLLSYTMHIERNCIVMMYTYAAYIFATGTLCVIVPLMVFYLTHRSSHKIQVLNEQHYN